MQVMLGAKYREMASPANFDRFLNGTVSERRRAELASNYSYDWHGRKIFFEPYFRALVLHHFTDNKSLNDLHAAINDDRLFQVHGAHMEVSLPALSKANANRPLEPFLDLLADVLAALGGLTSRDKVLRDLDSPSLRTIAQLLDRTQVFDATTFPLPAKIARWAQTRRGQAGFKLQLRIHAGYGGVDRIMFTKAAGNDNPYFLSLLDLEEGAGHIYLFDTGYFKLTTYDRIVQSGNHFVTVLHKNITYEVVEERPVPEGILDNGYVIHSDRIVRLGQGNRRSPHLYRLVDATDSRGNRALILTDWIDVPVHIICFLRTYRWTIETIFRWLKSQLKLKQFISYSPQGVILQSVVALIVYGLMVLYHRQGPLSIVRIGRLLRNDLHEAIYQQGRLDALREMKAAS